MKKTAMLAALGLLALGITGARALTMEMVTVGNAGNSADPSTGSLYGAVAYDYLIGKYEVTIGQYTEFLNAVAATDTYGLYNTSMGTDLTVAGYKLPAWKQLKFQTIWRCRPDRFPNFRNG